MVFPLRSQWRNYCARPRAVPADGVRQLDTLVALPKQLR